jgi:hypothetical protein
MNTILTHIEKLASYFVLVLILFPHIIFAQTNYNSELNNPTIQILNYYSTDSVIKSDIFGYNPLTGFRNSDIILNYHQQQDVKLDSVPDPKSVIYKSLIVPGWGQILNRQAWKVPIIYGLIVGVTTYTFYANKQYNGYKAAYYNSFTQNTDLKFGPTPDFVLAGQPPELYRTHRNNFRNRRDMAIIGIVLAYGLNVVDAYIFAQLRDFDVSDNLSGRVDMKAEYFAGISYPNLNFTLNF